jgi:hypothetical protein
VAVGVLVTVPVTVGVEVRVGVKVGVPESVGVSVGVTVDVGVILPVIGMGVSPLPMVKLPCELQTPLKSPRLSK